MPEGVTPKPQLSITDLDCQKARKPMRDGGLISIYETADFAGVDTLGNALQPAC
jgi:hypothetical protein